MRSVSPEYLTAASAVNRNPKAVVVALFGEDPFYRDKTESIFYFCVPGYATIATIEGGITVDWSLNALYYDSITDGFLTPDKKTILLDGNCFADGSYYPAENESEPQSKYGWWGNTFCDENGEWEIPPGAVYAGINQYGGTRFTIAFEPLRNEYAIDFDVFMASGIAGGLVSSVLEVRGNDKAVYTGEIEWTDPPEGLGCALFVIIRKWSAANTCPKIRQFLPYFVENYSKELLSASYLESIGAPDPQASFFDTASSKITLDNSLDKFFNPFQSDVDSVYNLPCKIRINIGFSINGIPEYTLLIPAYSAGGFSLDEQNKSISISANDETEFFSKLATSPSSVSDTAAAILDSATYSIVPPNAYGFNTDISGSLISTPLYSINVVGDSEAKTMRYFISEVLSACFGSAKLSSDGYSVIYSTIDEAFGESVFEVPEDCIYTSRIYKRSETLPNKIEIKDDISDTCYSYGVNDLIIDSPLCKGSPRNAALINRIKAFYLQDNFQMVEFEYSGNPALETGDIITVTLVNKGQRYKNDLKILRHELNNSGSLKGKILGYTKGAWEHVI